MNRIQMKGYALIDASNKLWQGRTASSAHGIFSAYGSRSAAYRDGYRLKQLTIYLSV